MISLKVADAQPAASGKDCRPIRNPKLSPSLP